MQGYSEPITKYENGSGGKECGYKFTNFVGSAAFELAFKSRRMTVAYDVATLPWTSDHYRYVLIMVDMFNNRAHLKQKEYYDPGKSPKNLKVGR